MSSNWYFLRSRVSEYPFAFAGSYALQKQGLLDREFSDIDIVIDSIFESSLLDEKILEVEFVKNITRSYKPNRFTDIKTIHFKDGTKMDLLFRSDFNLLDKVTIDGVQYLTVFEIMKEKINLIQQGNQKEKHIKDIQFIFTKL